jgi:hypothetical protein
MIKIAEYIIELRLNGVLIGNIQPLAQNLQWARRRTMAGVDSIDFTLNDVLFAEWCERRGTTIQEMLKPMALDCRIIRNGEPVIGGFLATMPAYSPRGTSADLALRFDGYTNLLAGVYMNPIGTQTGEAGSVFASWLQVADSRAAAAGKAFDFTAGEVSVFPTIQQTFDNYKTIKDCIADRADNLTGAGQFDLYWDADRTYNIIKDEDFGEEIVDYSIIYPMAGTVGAVSISAPEVDGFASSMIAVGAGEISSDATKNTAITYTATNYDAVVEYGYAETMYQDSSISVQATLERNAEARLEDASNGRWEPQITLSGRQVAPAPVGDRKIWIGDTVRIQNNEDMTGQTSGWFRVQELQVAVSAAGGEVITPVLKRVEE